MKKLSEFKCPPAKKKTGEKYCRLCEKREKRGTCGYGGKMWDRYTVDDVSQEEKEALGIVSAVKKFRKMVLGSHFKVRYLTDHKSLECFDRPSFHRACAR